MSGVQRYRGSKYLIRDQARHILASQIRFGQSKHAAKVGEGRRFGDQMAGIHSHSTFKAYTKAIRGFIDYAEERLDQMGCTHRVHLRDLKDLAISYLDSRRDEVSGYTLSLDKSALKRIYRDLEYQIPSRSGEEITRSRGEAVRDRHFSEEKNSDLVTICRSTGGRREDIEKLCRGSFFEDKETGRLFVRFEQSKGGRTRETPVLNADRVREIIAQRTDEPRDRLFERVHGAADVHGYRREYARTLYQELQRDREFRQDLERFYKIKPTAREYIVRDGTKERYDRDSMGIVSKSLGHNRIDTTIKNYIK